MNKRIHSIFQILSIITIAPIVLITLLCEVMSVNCAVPDTVRIGVVEQKGIAIKADDGYYYGFDAEYTYRVAQYAGFIPEFISFDNYDDVLNALEAGDIDMSVGVSKTPEREERFLFASNYYSQGTLNLCVMPDNNSYTYGNLQDVESMRIGVARGSSFETRIREWADDNNITINLITFNTEEEIYDSMRDGSIDATVLSTTMSADYRVIITFASSAYYPIFNKANNNLCNRVDSAINRIIYENNNYAIGLHDKYSAATEDTTIAFTSEELDYISSLNKLTIAVLHNNAPYYKETSEEQAGIIPDIYSFLTQETGIPCEYKAYRTVDEMCSAITSGEADIAGIVHYDSIISTKRHLTLTGHFESPEFVRVSHSSTSEFNTAVMTAIDYELFSSILKDKNIEMNLIAADNISDAFDILEKRGADCILCTSNESTWLMNNRRFGAYTVTNPYNTRIESSAAVSETNPVLSSIISKLSTNYSNHIAGIITENISVSSDFDSLLHRIPMNWMITFFLFLIAALALGMGVVIRSVQTKAKADLAISKAQADAARKAKDSVSAFLSNLSHDLRTPLNGIIGYTDLALQTDDPERKQGFMTKVESSSKLMLDLVNDVLDMSKIESGRLDLANKPFSLHELHNSVCSAIDMMAHERAVYFYPKFNNDDVFILGDSIRLQQIYMNLLSNAIKYNNSGGEVHWTCTVTTDSRYCYLETVIEDNGIGMSREFQARMFESFAQERQAGTEHIQGTGLGLAIVKRIVDALDGSIDVQSAINKGTKFTINLKFEITSGSSMDDAAPADTRTLTQLLTGRNILMAEDNEINAEIAEIILKQSGASIVDITPNGKLCIDKFSEHEPGYYAFILMDLRMPVMDGITAAELIRKKDRPDAATIPIIAMTADSFESDVQRCLDAGMNAHVSKPMQKSNLLDALRTLL